MNVSSMGLSQGWLTQVRGWLMNCSNLSKRWLVLTFFKTEPQAEENKFELTLLQIVPQQSLNSSCLKGIWGR